MELVDKVKITIWKIETSSDPENIGEGKVVAL